MIDIHSHILPGVDDGSKSMVETLAMLEGAKAAGVSAIIATPHVKAIETNLHHIREAYEKVKPLAARSGIRLHLGFECHARLFLDCDEPGDLRAFCIERTNVVLLEFPLCDLPWRWENDIYQLQRLGMEVILAHPERYAPVQADISIAARMIQIGCELQLSTGSLCAGCFSLERVCANKLLQEGLTHYLASDAHCAADYRAYAQVYKKYKRLIAGGALLDGYGA
ncbi:MAG: CpsB/CapC family capsule biosynthesis tyrosine phosphatase [Candidatus Pelethousia sp.]|nr:CpsB/CapC family capsule biosynthesis tyrosine phosphatase [Candidatus Pelethousia sp.]